ncbi:MAG: DUF3160 domain-containing protein [Chitinispirillales bacterium]|jgi:hypothetical protein|nr:DUF3160 domain-containing protein [Chitinispirillales bacterium]
MGVKRAFCAAAVIAVICAAGCKSGKADANKAGGAAQTGGAAAQTNGAVAQTGGTVTQTGGAAPQTGAAAGNSLSAADKKRLDSLKVFYESLKDDYLKKNLFDRDLSKLSMKDLLMLRSGVYAVNGLFFNEENLYSYFMANKNAPIPWYTDYVCFLMEDKHKNGGKGIAGDEKAVALGDAEKAAVEKIDARVAELRKKGMYITKNGNTVGDIAHVVNMHKVANTDKKFMDKLAQNNFAIVDSDTGNSQLFHIYEMNDYERMPSFVTVDLFLQVFHIKLSRLIKYLELGNFAEALEELTSSRHDAYADGLLRELVDAGADGARAYPKGLDALSALGSAPAGDVLKNFYKEESAWGKYSEEMGKQQQKFKNFDGWDKTVFNKWIESLLALQKRGDGCPAFMKTGAWEYKNLNTSLASMVELRKRDFTSYADDEPASAEGGCMEDCEAAVYYFLPEGPEEREVGYVEPNLPFWNKLDELIKSVNKTLAKHNVPDSLGLNVDFMISVSKKELAKKPLSADEYRRIREIGGEIENLTLSMLVEPRFSRISYDHCTGKPYDSSNEVHWSLVTGPAASIAAATDIYARNVAGDPKNGVLYAATGKANPIYVVVEIDGYLYLTRGAVFSYYEFVMPENTRAIDDRVWQRMEASKQRPAIQEWMKSVVVDNRSKPAVVSGVVPERLCFQIDNYCSDEY